MYKTMTINKQKSKQNRYGMSKLDPKELG